VPPVVMVLLQVALDNATATSATLAATALTQHTAMQHALHAVALYAGAASCITTFANAAGSDGVAASGAR